MSITSNFPAIKPTLLLDFANTKQLDPRITFTRASTATYYGTQTAKAEENLLLQSQDFTTTWSNVASTEVANTEVAPDGTTTADTLTGNAGTALKGIQQAIVLSGTYTFSIFLKAGTQSIAQLLCGGSGASATAFANFDLSAGTVGTTSGTSSIVSFGNGWYRCIFTGDLSGGISVYVSFVDSTSAARAASSASTGTLNLWGAQLEQRTAVSAYTATTTAPITNYIPQLLTAASGVARFDNNPTTFESLGLLIEESRTNLVTYSAQFDDAAWTKTRASITANTIVAPDGTLTGDKLVEDTTASNSHLVAQSIVFPASGTVTATIYAKAAERNFILFSRTTVNTCGVNLTTGQVVGVSGTDTTATTQSVGNGWWRIILVFPSPNTTATVNIYTSLDGVFANRDYTGDGYSGIFIWGAQLEAGAFATSYIPTVASQVTRAAEVATMTGTNFSSWYNASEGTVYFESQTAQGTSSYAYSLFGTSTSNRIFANYNSSLRMNSGVRVNGTFDVSVDTPNSSAPLNTFGKGATAYKVNDFGFSWNGATALTDTSTTLPIVLQLDIGNNNGIATNFLNGTIKKIAYYPLAATSAQLQGLTS